jgi:hypothetical protein
MVLTVGGCVALAVGCSALDAAPRPVDPGADLFERLTADPGAPGDDIVEVWVCAVPDTTTNSLYGDADLRLMISPEYVIERIGARVTSYYATVSFSRYDLQWRAGGIVSLDDADGAEECAEEALEQSSDEASVVLAVANAEHAEGKSGGWGRPGSWFECRAGVPDEVAADRECPASATGRAAYIGASDFSAAWGPVPLLDLVQHELGHALGLPHSGILVGMATGPESSELVYSSALDLMSNSAAAHDADPTRRDGPDMLGINRYDLGWLDDADVVTAEAATLADMMPDGGQVDLELELAGASTPVQGGDASSRTPRLAVVRLGDDRLLSIEYLLPTGLHDHLPEAGVSVHLVSDSVRDQAGPGVLRSQRPIGSEPPHTDLLGPGDSTVVDGFGPTVTVRVLELTPTGARLVIEVVTG